MARAQLLAGLTLFLCLQRYVCQYSGSEVAVHLDTLLAEYEADVAPAAAVAVAVALDVRHASVTGDTMLLLADLRLSWTDPRLSWNASVWSGDSALVLAERLWSPDVALRSAGRSRAAAGRDTRARLAASGAVSLVSRLELTAPVDLSLTDWPLDTQSATFIFASRSYSLDEVDLLPNKNKSLILSESGWLVSEVWVTRSTWAGADGEATAGASFTLVLERRGAALAAAHSAVLAASALLLAAALARHYTQRLPLAAVSALIAALWLMSAMVVVPGGAGGRDTPRVVRAMGAVCASGALAALLAALVQALARRTAPPPSALRALLSRLSSLHSITPHIECPGGETEGRGAWAAAAALADAALATLLALLLMVLLLVYYLA